MLRSYLAALGFRAVDEDFYMPDRDALLVEKYIPLYRGERAWTFEEVQMGRPWDREDWGSDSAQGCPNPPSPVWDFPKYFPTPEKPCKSTY